MGLFDRLTDRLTERVGDFLDEVATPDELRLQQERALKLMEQGHYDSAIASLRRLETARPDLARTHHLLGVALFRQGDPTRAASALRRALELREEPSTLLYAGLAMEQLHEWRAAQQHLQRALSLTPSAEPLVAEARFALGRVLLQMGRLERATHELRKALKLTPDDPSLHATLARSLHQSGQRDEALTTISAVGHALHSAADLITLGQLCHDAGQPERALDAYQRALDASDATPAQRLEGALGAGRVALSLRDLPLAERMLQRAQASGPRDLGAAGYTLQGQLLIAQHHTDRARDALREALARDPEHPVALLALARLHLDASELTQAQALYQRALDSPHVSMPEALLGLAQGRLRAGDPVAARQLLEEAAKRHPDLPRSPAHLLTLASAALAQGDPAEAILAAQDALATAQEAEDQGQARALLDTALTQLRPHWANLPASVDDPTALATLLRALRDYIAQDARLIDFLPATQRIMAALDAPLSIAIVGEFNAGKSTLINALIGETLVPMGVLPTTAHTGIIQYGPRLTTRVHEVSGEVREISPQEAKRLMKENGETIDHLDYLYPHPELRAVNFWDTPGFNALEERHERVAAKALEEAEAILWIMDANQVLSQSEFERISAIPDSAQRLFIVINKIDRLGEPGERDEAVAQLVRYVQAHAGEYIAGCYPVSALHALRDSAPEQPLPADHASGFGAFRGQLHEQIIARAGTIKLIEGKRHLGSLLITLAAFQHGLTRRYQNLRHDVARIHEQLRRDAPAHAEDKAQHELTVLEQETEALLQLITAEIQEALRPTSSWLKPRMVLDEEDRAYMIQLLRGQFQAMLDRSSARVTQDVVALETKLSQQLGPGLRHLALQDARNFQRRLDGFHDESRALRQLLQERVFGRLGARAEGQLHVAAPQALREMEQTQDPMRWRGLARQLLPELRPQLKASLLRWYEAFFKTADRLNARLLQDLTLLELEAKHRYDLRPLEQLILGELGEDEGAPEGAPE